MNWLYPALAGAVLAAVVGVSLYLNQSPPSEEYTEVAHDANEVATETPAGDDGAVFFEETEPPPGMQWYRNDEWGFAFVYPEDWEIRIPAFGSAVSLFNMAIEPRHPYNPEAILVNITKKDWIEGVLEKRKARGDDIHETEVAGLPTVAYEGEGTFGRNSLITHVLVGDKYWISIFGDIQHKKEYEHLLSTFTLLK